MSTPFVFSDEVPELYTVAPTDIVMLWDTSVGLMKRATVSAVKTIIGPASLGAAATSVIGFYGQTGVDQEAFTAAAITALATATISAGNAAAVWAWASSTMALEFVARAKQAQVDLKSLMEKLDSVGLVTIAGV